MNVALLLAHAAQSFPNRPALQWRGETLDYATFQARSAAFAAWLAEVGVASQQRVVLFLDNQPELLIAMFGTFHAGGTVVPCNSRLTVDELSFMVQDCDAQVIVTDAEHAEVALAAAGAHRTVLIAGQDFDNALNANQAPAALAEVAPTDTAWIFYTSGTTGRPKGAMLSHAALIFVTVSWLADLTPLDEHDITLHVAPLSHGAGFHALAATARAALQIIPSVTSFDPEAILELIRDSGVTNTWMVPTQIVMLTNAAPQGLTLPTLKYVVYGGAPITPTAMTRALHTFGSIFVQLYGQGETPMTATILRRCEHLPEFLGSAGRVRPGVELRIVGPDGNVLAADEVGELVLRGPALMSGYWNRPDATAETIVDGWLHTGDLARITTDGVVFLLDRTKDLIISGGSNIYAVEVEQVLARHPLVAEVAVIGVSDDLWGELVVAVVVAHVTAQNGEDQDHGPSRDRSNELLNSHCRQALAGYKVPRRYEFVDALPRNGYGKVLKRQLREQFGAEPETQPDGRWTRSRP